MIWTKTGNHQLCEYEGKHGRCFSARRVKQLELASWPAGFWCDLHRKELSKAWESALEGP